MIPSAMKLRSRYGELSMPVSIIAGDRDRVVTTDRQSARLHAELAGSEFETIKDAGHMVHHVAPDIVLASIFSAARSPNASSNAGIHRNRADAAVDPEEVFRVCRK